ncbi:MAG: zinc ribbon domain-containing protein [Candidatus Kariarchaeaceae archaeon]|jgi:hypothetical protein
MIESFQKETNDINFFALSLLLQLSGTIIFTLGILNLIDGFFVFFLSLSMWTISSFYKGSNSWIIIAGLIGSGMLVLFALVFWYIDSFLGFFFFLYLYILAGANYVNNKGEFSNEDKKETGILSKKNCSECGEKMQVDEIFCGNCGHKMSN